MGYLGFGMQKWIYSRSPRKKLFEKRGIPSFNEIPKYNRNFSLKPSKKENKALNGLLTISIVIGFLFVVFSSLTSFKHYSNNHTKQIIDHNNYQSTKAFKFLMDSGKSRLRHNRPLAAYSEFKLAQKIYPNNEELHRLFSETLGLLCIQDGEFCAEWDGLLYNN